jgi:hypothetical protein
MYRDDLSVAPCGIPQELGEYKVEARGNINQIKEKEKKREERREK